MNQEKFADLQFQIKQNNAEYQDFLKGLDSWEENVKAKEKKLKEVGDKPAENKLPPVRNSLDKKKKKKKKKPKTKESDKNETKEKKKIGAYDFRSWDKFDVDAACKQVDEHSSSESEYETDEEWEIERMRLIAVQHKEQGNQYFKEGDYINAVEYYTKGIDCDPSNAVLPANRAMALLKQEKFAAAELDCSQSISLDPSYLKAYHRRGTARAALKKYSEAKEDFVHVLKEDPKNKQAKAELEKVDRLLNPPKLLQSKNLETSDKGIVKAVYKPPNQRSKKPLHRIQIEEIGEDELEEKRKARMKAAQEKQSETKKSITATDNAMFDKLIQGDTEDSSSLSNAGEKIKVLIKETTDESDNLDTKIDRISNTKAFDTSGFDARTQSSSKTGDKTVKGKTNDKSDPTKSEVDETPCTSPRIPPVPASSYQFQADWKVLKNYDEKFYQYFKEIEPTKFSKLFGQFLDSDVLVKIFRILQNFYLLNSVDPYPVLLNLCDVKRFSMTVMFMSTKDKSVLKELFTQMKTQRKHTDQEIEKLCAKYEV